MQRSPVDPAHRQELLNLIGRSIKEIHRMYDGAKQSGIEQPLLLLAECKDRIGGKLARSVLGDAAVNKVLDVLNGGCTLGTVGISIIPCPFDLHAPDFVEKYPPIAAVLATLLEQVPEDQVKEIPLLVFLSGRIDIAFVDGQTN